MATHQAKQKVIEEVYYDFYKAFLDVQDDDEIEKEFGKELLDVLRWTEKARRYRLNVIRRIERKHRKRTQPIIERLKEDLAYIFGKIGL